MSSLPPQLDRDRHVLLRGRGRQPLVRRVALTGLAVVVALAVANVFGQDATTSTAASSAAASSAPAPFDLILLVVVGSLSKVRFAVLETNGTISFVTE